MKKTILLFLFFILLSCANRNYNDSEVEFFQYLEANYKAYGNYKENNYDWKAARRFYIKSDAVKKGKRLMPEKVFTNVNLVKILTKEISYEQLIDMRDRMFIVLETSESKINYPEETANLQFYFDCWVLEEELYQKYSQIARCKQGFIDTLSYLEFKLLRLNTNEKDLIQKEIDNLNIKEDIFIRPKTYAIYFDFDSSVLTEDSARVLREFLKSLKNISGKYIINIVGHADRTGAREYNEKLSKRRTETIKHYLVKNGVLEKIIATKWQGEIDPRVITRNDDKESLNRRVFLLIEML